MQNKHNDIHAYLLSGNLIFQQRRPRSLPIHALEPIVSVTDPGAMVSSDGLFRMHIGRAGLEINHFLVLGRGLFDHFLGLVQAA